MAHRTETVRTIDLDHDQMLIFDGGRDGRVRVLHGGAWLTEEGDAADAFLRAGAEARFHGRRTLIEALGPTQLQVVQQGASMRSEVQAAWRRMWSRLRLGAIRHQLGATAAQSRA